MLPLRVLADEARYGVGMTALLMHAWTAFPVLVIVMVAVWALMLYVAGRVVRIWMERED